jgi:hypothetical protein
MDAERPVLPFERPSSALRLAMVVVGVTLFALYAVLAGAVYQRASRPASGLLATLYVHAEEDEDPVTRLLATHPPMDERVARLVAMVEAREQEATSEAVRIQVR